MRTHSISLTRRSVLALGLAGVAGCGSPGRREEPGVTTSSVLSRGRVLLAYFSRPGENYHNGGRRTLEIGNTQVVAEMIQQSTGCDVYRITAADPYSDNYDTTVQRNVREQNSDARPAIVDPPASLDGYDTVLLGSPIWNVRPLMIMSTFTEAYDFTDTTVLPLVTYAVSGLGRTVEIYTASCRGATFGEALAVRGEEVADSRAAVDAWLRRVGLTR
jgi:flavodoxin